MILNKGLRAKTAGGSLKEEGKQYGMFSSLIWGVIVALLLLTICSIVLAFVYTKSNVDVAYVNACKYLILIAALFIGGRSAAKKGGKKGLFHGLAVAICFLIIAAIVTINNAELELLPAVFKGIIAVLSGAIGGISGVK